MKCYEKMWLYSLRKWICFICSFFEFERKYLYNADELTERLEAQLMKPIKNQMQEIYQQVIALDSAFKD